MVGTQAFPFEMAPFWNFLEWHVSFRWCNSWFKLQPCFLYILFITSWPVNLPPPPQRKVYIVSEALPRETNVQKGPTKKRPYLWDQPQLVMCFFSEGNHDIPRLKRDNLDLSDPGEKGVDSEVKDAGGSDELLTLKGCWRSVWLDV